jgi:hypothetical protein
MEYVWNTYGIPMEHHANNTEATRQPHSGNTLQYPDKGIPIHRGTESALITTQLQLGGTRAA